MKKFSFLVLLLSATLCRAQITNPAPYCDASFDDMQGFTVDDHINSVSFGTLTNASNSQYAAPHYVFYNNLSVKNFTKGSTYTLSVNFKTAGGCGYGVWIDYNRNNVFETSERIAGTTGTDILAVGGTPTINQSVIIPTTASVGNTRMRVRIVEDDNHNMVSTSQLPCNASTSATDVMDWGETEDYTINITSATAVEDSPEQTKLNIFPNPFESTFTINGLENNSLIIISDLMGKVLFKQYADNTISFDFSNIPSGVYFVRNGNAVSKIVKN